MTYLQVSDILLKYILRSIFTYLLKEKPLQIENKDQPKYLITMKLFAWFHLNPVLNHKIFKDFVSTFNFRNCHMDNTLRSQHIFKSNGKTARNKISINDFTNPEDFMSEPYLHGSSVTTTKTWRGEVICLCSKSL